MRFVRAGPECFPGVELVNMRSNVASNRAAPLGVFDSGLGGLTVVRALKQRLPQENIVYLGDTARVPYGTRTAATVCRYAEGCASVLLEHDIKALVVACNTVSAVALDSLSAQLSVPVIGVVEPGARAALAALAELTPAGMPQAKIGVLGTEGTIRSGAYARAIERASPGAAVLAATAPLLVPLAEEGWLSGDVPRLAVERYVAPLIGQGASVLLLGCTHYPLFAPVISEVAERLSPGPVRVVDSAEAVAKAVAELLEHENLANTGSAEGWLRLFATDLPVSFHAAARRFLGGDVLEVMPVDITDARPLPASQSPSR